MGVDPITYGTPRLDLGVALQEYMQGPSSFIGTGIFPMTPVNRQKAKYPVITRKSLLALADTKRAARSAYNRTNFQTDEKDFSCEEHGLEGQLDVTERKLYVNDFDAEMETSKDILMKLLRAQEMRIAALAFSETTFNSADCFSHCSVIWSTTASAKVIKDIQDAKLKVFNNCGMDPNVLVVSRATLNNMILNAEIVGRIQYAQAAGWAVVMQALANLVGVDRIVVGNGVYDSKPEGATAATVTKIWSDTYALLAIVPTGGSLVQPSLGRTFNWVDDSPENVMVESYDEQQTRSTIFRVRQFTDEAVIEKQFGCLIDVSATS